MKGGWAEAIAQAHLEGKGYTLVARNKRTPYGELDLWMKDGDCWVAVEVKQRSSERFGTPLEAITPKKFQHMYNSVLHLLQSDTLEVRFEAVLVYGTAQQHRLEHIALNP